MFCEDYNNTDEDKYPFELDEVREFCSARYDDKHDISQLILILFKIFLSNRFLILFIFADVSCLHKFTPLCCLKLPI